MSLNRIYTYLTRAKKSHVYATLILASLLGRLPFWGVHNLVAYDGTYYLNQARSLLTSTRFPGSFPIGYPAFVVLFHTIIKDVVLAAQLVSLAASLGSAIVFYHLARHFIRREAAILSALAFSLNPLFIRFSLMTLSESLYIFWLLLGLLFITQSRFLSHGISMGIAASTRPEAIGILAILSVIKLRRPKQFFFVFLGFFIFYLPNIIYLSHIQGQPVFVPKTQLLGTSAEDWRRRERFIDTDTEYEISSGPSTSEIIKNYFRRLPRETVTLAKNISPLLFVLAIIGLCLKRSAVLTVPLLPFVAFPLMTPASEDRFILPYIAPLLIFAFITIEFLRYQRWRRIIYAAVFLAVLANPLFNRFHLLKPEAPGFLGSKTAGIFFRDKITPKTKIADRKPFFAFYAEGFYDELPAASYEETMKYLVDANIELLSLQRQTVEHFRQALRPLLYDRQTILGELRLEQVYFLFNGDQVVYRRISDRDPITWHELTGLPDNAVDPSWSPDGKFIAFRSLDPNENGTLLLASSLLFDARPLARNTLVGDPISWSRDGIRLAFAASWNGNTDIYAIDTSTGKLTRVTTHESDDRSPAWTWQDEEILFSSDRGGHRDIWLKNMQNGDILQLSNDGGNTFPTVAPDGHRGAWIKTGIGVLISDHRTGEVIRANGPQQITQPPAWSLDGRYIAVAAEDWGNLDIYLLKSDGSHALRLTKTIGKEMSPNWGPSFLTVSSDRDGVIRIWSVDNLDPYLDRLENPGTIHTYDYPEYAKHPTQKAN